jgi:hypothetical protein
MRMAKDSRDRITELWRVNGGSQECKLMVRDIFRCSARNPKPRH